MSDSDLSVGWIGAGRMGAAMAVRLARAGVKPRVWNRTRAKAEAIADQGCGVADTIADLRDRDVVFTMVSTPADLEQVLLGEGGLLVDPAHLPGVGGRLLDRLDRVVRAHPGGVRRAPGSTSWPRRSAATARSSPPAGSAFVVLRSARGLRRGRADLLGHWARRVTYVGEGDAGPAGQDLPQPHARRGHPDAGRDHRAGREGRGVAGGVPRVPQRQRDGLDLHAATSRRRYVQPRLHADVHPGAAAQGLRPRAAPPPDELGVPMPVAAATAQTGAGGGRAGPGRRGLRGPARPAGPRRPGSS